MNRNCFAKHGIRLLLMMLCLFSFNSMRAQTNIVSLSGPETVKPGSTFEMSIDLSNETTMQAFEAHILFPQGFEPVIADDKNNVVITKSERGTASHMLSGRWHPENNELVITCFSFPLTNYTGTEGPICSFEVEAANDLKNGDYVFSFTGEKFVLDTADRTKVPFVDQPLTIKVKATSGIDEIEMESTECDTYNVLGQRVSDRYQGIVIENGQKILRNK